MLGHARISITLDTYTHLFDDARHTNELRARMSKSDFASLLSADLPGAAVSALRPHNPAYAALKATGPGK